MLVRLRSSGTALLVPVVACLAVAAILFATASRSDDAPSAATPTPDATARPTLLNDAQVLANRRGTPAHAAILFWQAAQFGDVTGAYELLSERLRADVSERRFSQLLADASTDLHRLPQVVSVSGSGRTRRVRMALYDAAGKNVDAATVSVVDEGGWRVDDLFYLEAATASGDRADSP